jgi:exopolyphosphatase/guanosine-5'-triphosphate,3'-diphosphate pyrophosphatase
MSEEAAIRLAAIDTGSNAIRLVIGRVYGTGPTRFMKREASYRIPIRLGDDVFGTGSISVQKADLLIEAFHAFGHLLTVFSPTAVRACATSAMREASNGLQIASQIRQATGIHLEIITGEHEAGLLFANNFKDEGLDPQNTYLFIDVGGGSTELTLMDKGNPLSSESFRIGTVRSLQGQVLESERERMKLWIEKMPRGIEPTLAIGTGGNIGKIFDLAEHASMDQRISRKSIKDVLDKLEIMSLEDRIRKLSLKPDRADVIIPAGRIYSQVMKLAEIKDMIVPKVGVSDGILQELFGKVGSGE